MQGNRPDFCMTLKSFTGQQYIKIAPRGQICDIDSIDSAAIIEGFFADAGQAIWDGDGGQTAATKECFKC